MKFVPIAASLLLTASGAMALPMPSHIYDLNGSYADTLGGPAMTPTGGTLSGAGFGYNNGEGLTTTAAIADPAAYSIEMVLRMDSHPAPYARLVYSNGTDNGLYIRNVGGVDRVDYYRAGGNDGSAFSLGSNHHLIFTRDAGSMVVWLDGAVALSLVSDASSIITTPVALFLDDSTEFSAGSIDFIRFYDGVLDAHAVGELWNGGSPLPSSALTGGVPEPASWALLIAGMSVVGIAMRRRPAMRTVSA